MFPCEPCKREFKTSNAFKQHLRDSQQHQSYSQCRNGSDAINELNHCLDHTPSNLRKPSMSTKPTQRVLQHNKKIASTLLVKEPTNHVFHCAVDPEPYSGIPSSQIQPVFRAACRLRYSDPQTSQILAATETTLETDIVAAIIEGALRLVAPDRSLVGETLRKQKVWAKAARALRAEVEFVDKVRPFQCKMMDETQQKQRIQDAVNEGSIDAVRMTPDVLFLVPTVIHGVSCNWIEFKNSFGFKSDPFVHRKNRKQYQKYVTALGSGMVVYKLGYESGLLGMNGVACFREAEIVDWIQSQTCRQ